VRVDDKTRALFGRVASCLEKREGKDDKALATKLTRIADAGEVGKGDGLTNADANIVQGRLNVLHEMAEQSGQKSRLLPFLLPFLRAAAGVLEVGGGHRCSESARNRAS
jgi:hypothetical protein